MRRPDPKVTVVGGGLAGCEAAWQLLTRGVPVLLVDIKLTSAPRASKR